MAQLTLQMPSLINGDTSFSLSTDKNTFLFTQEGEPSISYTMSLVDISFQKKMYQPTEITAVIHIEPKSNVVKEWFNHQKVILSETSNANETKELGNDYYVHEVLPCYKSSSMLVTLKICSLDKLLTLHAASRTFVAQKLAEDLLTNEISNYQKPYTDETKTLKVNTTKMKQLYYKVKVNNQDVQKEHIFPYLVQYNESFYDLLKRTTNRWGEFLYYENGELTIGYDESNKVDFSISDNMTVTYCYLNGMPSSVNILGELAAEAAYDNNIFSTELKRSPNEVKGQFFNDDKKGGDSYWMKRMASLLANNKSLPELIANRLVDDIVSNTKAGISVAHANSEFDSTYFPEGKCTSDHYGDGENDESQSYNQFTEYKSTFDEGKYRKILKNEHTAARSAVRIDYDTEYPNLKLGQIITIDKSEFIVTEVNGKLIEKKKWKVNDDNEIVEDNPTTSLFFQVIAIGQVDGSFYPPVLPSGHIRLSEPQIGYITDVNDPAGRNRVRILFSWQYKKINYDNKTDENGNEIETDDQRDERVKKEKEEQLKNSSPWLIYATNAATKKSGYFGMHYEDDIVLVAFAHGNVERPYIAGGLAMEGNNPPGMKSLIGITPGGHALKLDDGEGNGGTAFLTGILSPLYDTIHGFIPLPCDWFGGENAKYFEGGFELSDKYGIYSIKGSTNERNISIKSPWGDVRINAFTGITINAPNGDITIKGKNVTIEAGNNLTLTSGKNIKNKFFKTEKGDSVWDTVKGSSKQLGYDVSAAVATRLSSDIAGIIDLSFIRSVLEIFFRPIEGALTIQSNRYLKLGAAGKLPGYPVTAYRDQAKATQLVEKAETEKLHGGLAVDENFRVLFDKVKTIAKKIETDYVNQYNKCISLKATLDIYINVLFKDPANDPSQPICRKYDDADHALKDKLWGAPPYKPLTQDDLAFTDNFKIEDISNVTDECVQRNHSLQNPPPDMIVKWKKEILKKRKKNRAIILNALNELRKAICELQQLRPKKSQISKTLGAFRKAQVKDYKRLVTNAFSEPKCDSFYFNFPANDSRKDLSALIFSNNLTDNTIILRRKVAINLLEEVGFKEGWRTSNGQNPVPPKPTSDADLIDNNIWNAYVNSLSAVPKISLDRFAVTQGIISPWGDKGKDWFNSNINVFKGMMENHIWSEGKDGRILFAYNNDTYNLESNIHTENTNYGTKENLTEAEGIDGDVHYFLWNLKICLRKM